MTESIRRWAERAGDANYLVNMWIVDVTHGSRIAEEQLLRLARILPHAVSLPVECPEEPYDEVLQLGDVEVRSKWSPSRAETLQERVDQLCDAVIEAAATRSAGVYLSVPVAAWSQGE